MNAIRRIGAILVVAIALTACQEEILTPYDGTKDLGHEIELTMSASMSDVVIPTRSLTDADEKAITRLDVLVFNENDTFAYTVQANSPTVTGSTLSYTVRLKKDIASKKYKLVLLANLGAAPTIAGTGKEEVLAAITFIPTKDWDAGGTIPMWADYPTAAAVTTSTTNTSFGTPDVIRSLARVNVSNDAASTFTLTKVWVYNSTNTARVAPELTKYNRTDKKVTGPSIATNAATIDVYDKTPSGNKVEREIYIGESEDKPVGDASAVCLVLEGNYGGNYNFYRVDMVDKDGKPLDILRNHTYNVNIKTVAGSGYSTKDEAFASMPINITVEIKEWNDANLNDITTDGQYSLAVDKGSVEVDGIAGTGSITYSTNYPNTVTVDVSGNWITKTSLGNTSPITFSYLENTSTTTPRTGSITITAGRIAKKITINQAKKPYTYVGMFGGKIIGAGTEGDPYKFPKPLYVAMTEKVEEWASKKVDHSALAGSKIDGRANTWNLNKETANGGSLTGFPAANLCFNKNSDTEQASKDVLLWYLPAQEQLMGIWITHNGSGASLGIGDYADFYWSSSEDNTQNSWCIDFRIGESNSGLSKFDRNKVRCVREIP